MHGRIIAGLPAVALVQHLQRRAIEHVDVQEFTFIGMASTR